MKNEKNERNTKHEHSYTVNISIKGISYAAVIGVLGFFGFGAGDSTADHKEIIGCGNECILALETRIEHLENRLMAVTASIDAKSTDVP